MDRKSKELINLIQDDFPIESRPFFKIAKKLDMQEDEVINIIRSLEKNNYIKRIGAIYNLKKLGYCSTLCAIRVPQDRILEVAAVINKNDGVTHNYIRNNYFNMWFTVIAPKVENIQTFLNDIKLKTGIKELIELPAINFFKIKVNFNLKE